MMRYLAAIMALVCLVETRPQQLDIRPSISFDPYILGGEEATPGEFPWQLSLERLGVVWSHSCGASLLTTGAALTAAHCLDGSNVDVIQIVAGLHKRSDQSDAQISAVTSYLIHEAYEIGAWTYPNDIAIITLAKQFTLGPTVALLTLPPDNSNQFVGTTCTLSGWGRTSASNELSDVLQKVEIPVITTQECNDEMATVSGAICHDSHIAVYDIADDKGTCNGDSGSPLNCPDGGEIVVAGLTSWGISGGGSCLPTYPSVCTRTSFYLDWIPAHTPPNTTIHSINTP